MKSLLAASAIVVAGACYVAAQQQSVAQQTNTAQQSSTDQQTPGQQPATNQATPAQTNPSRFNQPGEQASQGRHDLNFYITDCLIGANHAEITLARLAEQRATDPEIKQFAQRMIQDHTQFMQKLQQAQGNSQSASGVTPADAAAQSRTAPGQPNGVQQAAGQTPDQSTTNGPGAATNPNQVAGQPGDVNGNLGPNGRMNQRSAARQFVHLEKQVHDLCLQSKMQELSRKQGAQFDKCYISGQVAAHMDMADHLKVFGPASAGNLQAICQEGLQTTHQHLQMAKQIAERLEGNATSQSSANRNVNPQGQQ